MIDSPSDRSPEKAPRWDLMGTEGIGGGKVVSWLPLMFLGYQSIYRRKKYIGGAPWGPRGGGHANPPGHALPPRARLAEFETSTPSLLGCFRAKKDHREDFIPFGFRLIFLFYETLK